MIECCSLWRPQVENLVFVKMNMHEIMLCITSDYLVNIIVRTSEPLAPEAKGPTFKDWKSLRYPGSYLFGFTQSNILRLK